MQILRHLPSSQFFISMVPVPLLNWAKTRHHDFVQTLQAPFKGPTNYRYKGPGPEYLKSRFVYVVDSRWEIARWAFATTTIAAVGTIISGIPLLQCRSIGTTMAVGSFYELACFFYDYNKNGNTLEKVLNTIVEHLHKPLPSLSRVLDPSKPFTLTPEELAGEWTVKSAVDTENGSPAFYLFKTKIKGQNHVFAYYFGKKWFVPTPWNEVNEGNGRSKISCSNCLEGVEIEPLLRSVKPQLFASIQEKESTYTVALLSSSRLSLYNKMFPEPLKKQIAAVSSEFYWLLKALPTGFKSIRFTGQGDSILKSRAFFLVDSPYEFKRWSFPLAVIGTLGVLFSLVGLSTISSGLTYIGLLFACIAIDEYRQGNTLRKALQSITKDSEVTSFKALIDPSKPLLEQLTAEDIAGAWTVRSAKEKKEGSFPEFYFFKRIEEGQETIRAYYCGRRFFTPIPLTTVHNVKFQCENRLSATDIPKLMLATK